MMILMMMMGLMMIMMMGLMMIMMMITTTMTIMMVMKMMMRMVGHNGHTHQVLLRAPRAGVLRRSAPCATASSSVDGSSQRTGPSVSRPCQHA
jgi:hypothetical protein